MKKTILILTFLFAIPLFAQSNYEVLLSRPDITGLTGGTATDLDGIPTTGLAEGSMVAVFDGTETRIYRLTSGTNAESSPGVIRPDDFADPGNAKVWIASLSSDPGETGYTPTGDNLGNHTATTDLNLNGNYLSGDGDAEGIYVDTDGYIGIGTTMPEHPLQVGEAGSYGVDQQNLTAGTPSGWGDVSQSFTAGITGTLTDIEVDVWIASAPQNVTLSIHSGTGGFGPTLSTQVVSITQTAMGTPTKFTLATPVSVTSGNVYSIFFSGLFGITINISSASDVYPAGQICNAGNNCASPWDVMDFWFKTYVNVAGSPFVIDATGNVGIGTTTPTSALDVVGLPVYANNAAAIAGGLTAGAFYRTGGDPDIICVVH